MHKLISCPTPGIVQLFDSLCEPHPPKRIGGFVFVQTNESTLPQKDISTILLPPDWVYMGVSCLHNLDILAQLPSSPKLALLVDANPDVTRFLNAIVQLIRDNPDKNEFKRKLIDDLMRNPYLTPLLEGMDGPLNDFNINSKLGNWYQYHYDHIRAMILGGRILCGTMDICSPAFDQLATTVKVDFFYISNVHEWAYVDGYDQKLLNNLRAICKNTTHILCSKLVSDHLCQELLSPPNYISQFFS